MNKPVIKAAEGLGRAFSNAGADSLDSRRNGVFHPANDEFGDARNIIRLFGDKWIRRRRIPPLTETAAKVLYQKRAHSNERPGPEEIALMAAVIQTAERAQYRRGREPGRGLKHNKFHNARHFAHVLLFAHYLGEVDGEMPFRRRLRHVLAALGHDLDHMGQGSSPPFDLFKNEKPSCRVVRDIMEACGCNPHDIRAVELMILTTSPLGPRTYLEVLMKANREQYEITHEEIKEQVWARWSGNLGLNEDQKEAYLRQFDENGFEEFLLDENLVHDAAILCDADILSGILANEETAIWLNQEEQAFRTQDYTTARSCLFFLNEMIGEKGFYSPEAIAVFGDCFQDLRDRKTEELRQSPATVEAGQG